MHKNRSDSAINKGYLRKRLLATIVVMGLFFSASMIMVEWQARAAEMSSRVVNLSGRQRMLSMKIVSLVTQMQVAPDAATWKEFHADLQETIDLIMSVHTGLLEGDETMGLPGTQSPEVRNIYSAAPHFLDRKLSKYTQMARDFGQTGTEMAPRPAEELEVIWEQGAVVVAGLDELTTQFEMRGLQKVQRIERVSRLLMWVFLASLGALWFLSFRPLERRIVRDQTLLRRTKDAIPDGLLTLNEHGRILSCNPAADRMLGTEPGELVNGSFARLFATERADEINGRLQDCKDMTREPELQWEAEGARKDGTHFPMEVSLTQLQLEDQTGLLAIIRDIRDRKQAESELLVRNRAVDAATCGILITNPNKGNVIVYCNKEFQTKTGYSKEELVGRNPGFLQGDDPGQGGARQLGAAVEMGQGASSIVRNYRKNGEPFWNQVEIAPVHDATGKVSHFVGISSDLTARIESEDNLRRNEERFRNLYNRTPVMLHSVNAQGELIAVSDHWLRVMGYDRDEVLGKPSATFLDEDSRRFTEEEAIPALMQAGHCENISLVFVRKNGDKFDAELSAMVECSEDGEVEQVLAVINDVTARNIAQAKLQQAQKMESIGQLTGGIAHDFNNLLAVIMGNLQLVERRVKDNDRALSLVANALAATNQGANLTRQLLAFARKQPLEPTRIWVNELVRGMEQLMRRTLGERIEIVLNLEDDVAPSLVDRAQLESALLNLSINARDAMPDGGRLLFETCNRELDDDYIEKKEAAIEPGNYVMIGVTDNGAGMHKDVLAQIFEPFFTTKKTGEGTGLGLSMVYGFVKQSNGHLDVYSEPGQGTTFRLFLPIDRKTAVRESEDRSADAEMENRGQGEHILIVEDDDSVRSVNVLLLEELGYLVTAASNGDQALELLESDAEFALLFSDVVMPGSLTGIQLAEQARTIRPAMHILLTSGYPRDTIDGVGKDYSFISKPFSEKQLAQKLRELLGIHIASIGSKN